MSALTFREQAAIALAAAHYNLDVSAPDEPSRYIQCTRDYDEAIADAQSLADAACEVWGHEVEGPIPEGFTRACARCGQQVKP